MNTTQCPECARENLYTTQTLSGGGYGPLLLPGLGGFLRPAMFTVLICGDCGYTRFFARADALAKLPDSKRWKRI